MAAGRFALGPLTLAVAVSALVPPPALAAEGDPDTSFGTGGKVLTQIGDAPANNAIAFDSQGRVVVAGQTVPAGNGGSLSDSFIARYLPNGILDASFNGGTGFTEFSLGDYDVLNAVAVDSQDRIVAAGSVNGTGSQDHFSLVRYLPSGAQDPSFPSGARPFGSNDDVATALALDSQGRIVVSGFSVQGSEADFALARYDSSGLLDHSFGTNGKTTTAIPGALETLGYAMTIDGQGRIVVAGRVNIGGRYQFAVARYDPSGNLDPSFGTGGIVTTPIGTDSLANAVTIDAQNRVIVVGQSFGTDADWAIARYMSSGQLDPSFGAGGKVVTAIGDASDDARAVAIDAQGRIVVGGTRGILGTGNTLAIARYLPSGQLDPSFGDSGEVLPTHVSDESGRALAIDSANRIVLAGFDQGFTPRPTALVARYVGDAVAPEVMIGTGPPSGGFTNDRTPTFAFSASEPSAFTCALDGLSSSCRSPYTSPQLADGSRTFSLTATDAAGNASAPVTRVFTVDTRKPELKIKGKGRVKTRGRKAKDKLKLTASEPATFRCKVDRKKAKSCRAKYKTPKLKLGKHRVKVTATDRAGNRVSKTKKLKVVRRG